MIILIKNNKGGIGKTFLTSQIASGLAQAGKKVLIITSDSQNNIFNMLKKNYQGADIQRGLLASIREKDIFSIKLRENLEFIPLEKTLFIAGFREKFHNWLSGIKENYDFIFIDSTPVLNLDSVFIEIADKIIIPICLDESSLMGTINLLNVIPPEKVFGFILNKFEKTKIQLKYKKKLENIIKDDIYIIKKSSELEKMADKKKTIWDYDNKRIQDVKEEFFNIISKLLIEGETK